METNNKSIDYRDNHPNKEIALAMEVIIQIGHLFDDKIYEITPNMRKYLESALYILKQYEPKNNQIKSLIKHGTYYLDNMDVLTDNVSNLNYLIMPAF